MKKTLLLCLTICIALNLFAQAPEKMSYQAIVRDAGNAVVANASVGMQISILKGSAGGTAVYVETQTPTTNVNGLVSIEIGGGSVVSGTFANIDWSNDSYFVKTETDPAGGTTYTITGTSQLLSVPYALHSKTADKIIGANPILTVPLWQGGSNYVMSNTSGSDLSNCESGFDPTILEASGNIEVCLVIRITSTSAGTTNFQLRTHDGTTQSFPIVNTDSWTFQSTQSGIVAKSEWKDFSAGTNSQEVHLFGWVNSGATNFNSAYLLVRKNN